MPNAKIYISAFLMGGFYCAIGQLFLLFWSPILGPAFSMAATLLSMGVVAGAGHLARTKGKDK